MRLVHHQHEIGQAGEVIEIALADLFTEAAYAWRRARRGLRIDL